MGCLSADSKSVIGCWQPPVWHWLFRVTVAIKNVGRTPCGRVSTAQIGCSWPPFCEIGVLQAQRQPHLFSCTVTVGAFCVVQLTHWRQIHVIYCRSGTHCWCDYTWCATCRLQRGH